MEESFLLCLPSVSALLPAFHLKGRSLSRRSPFSFASPPAYFNATKWLFAVPCSFAADKKPQTPKRRGRNSQDGCWPSAPIAIGRADGATRRPGTIAYMPAFASLRAPGAERAWFFPPTRAAKF